MNLDSELEKPENSWGKSEFDSLLPTFDESIYELFQNAPNNTHFLWVDLENYLGNLGLLVFED